MHCRVSDSNDSVNDAHAAIFSAEKNKLLSLNRNSDFFVHYVTNYDIAFLIELSERYPEIEEVCKQKCLDDHWENVLRHSGKITSTAQEQKHHAYKPQATIHSFDIVRGLFAYNNYLKNLRIDQNEAASGYLILAVNYGNFSGLNAVCKNLIRQLKTDKEPNPNDVYLLIQTAERAAALYWTAGYVLLANIQLELANLAKLIRPDQPSELIKTCILASLQAYIVAEKLEPDSTNMINNAFEGKSLNQATSNRLLNWEQQRNHLYDLARWLHASDIELLYQKANQEVNRIREQYTSHPTYSNRLGS